MSNVDVSEVVEDVESEDTSLEVVEVNASEMNCVTVVDEVPPAKMPQSNVAPNMHRGMPSPLVGEGKAAVWKNMRRVFLNAGVSNNQLKAGLLAMVVGISARLNDPLVLLISEESHGVLDGMLNACKTMLPKDMYCDLRRLKDVNDEVKGSAMYGKTIIPSFFQITRKNRDELLETMKNLTRLDSWDAHIKRITGSGKDVMDRSAAWIIRGSDSEKPIHDPHVLRTQVQYEQSSELARVSASVGAVSEKLHGTMAAKRVELMLNKLEPALVEVPFVDSFQRAFGSSPGSAEKVKNLLKVIRTVTVVSKVMEFDELDSLAKSTGFCRPFIESYCQARDGVGVDTASIIAGKHPVAIQIKATKEDYYYAWLLCNDIFTCGCEPISPRQERIFEVVREINLSRLRGTTFTDVQNSGDVLSSLHASTDLRSWASREEINQKMEERGFMESKTT